MYCKKVISIFFVTFFVMGIKGDSSKGNNDEAKGSTALDNFPLIDGHNDLPWTLALHKQNQLRNFHFTKNLTEAVDFTCPQCPQTDLEKMKMGKIGAQFWVAYVHCSTQYKDAVTQTLEQIDLIKRFVNKYSNDLEYVTSSRGILRAFRNKKIASLIGVEGGHSLNSRLSVLRMYYELGVRYMTLTHMCNTPWADASPTDMGSVHNLTDFGKKIILEMNRLGMMVDLSHVSYNVMMEVLAVTHAPVMFSHSSAHSIHPHHRNVRDDVLKQVKRNKGVVMVNFYADFVGKGDTSIATVAEHINHIADVCGVGCVGIGADYNGVPTMPKGLEDVSKFPDLFDFLKEQNPERWTIANLEKLAGRNFIRVFRQVEKDRDHLKGEEPAEDWISVNDLTAVTDESLRKCSVDLRIANLS